MWYCLFADILPHVDAAKAGDGVIDGDGAHNSSIQHPDSFFRMQVAVHNSNPFYFNRDAPNSLLLVFTDVFCQLFCHPYQICTHVNMFVYVFSSFDIRLYFFQFL